MQGKYFPKFDISFEAKFNNHFLLNEHKFFQLRFFRKPVGNVSCQNKCPAVNEKNLPNN